MLRSLYLKPDPQLLDRLLRKSPPDTILLACSDWAGDPEWRRLTTIITPGNRVEDLAVAGSLQLLLALEPARNLILLGHDRCRCWPDVDPQATLVEQVRLLALSASVSPFLQDGSLRLHAWFERVDGTLTAYDSRRGSFVAIRDQQPPGPPPRAVALSCAST